MLLSGASLQRPTEFASAPLEDSSAVFGLQSGGELSLDLSSVRALDLRTGDPVRIAFYSVGPFRVTAEEF